MSAPWGYILQAAGHTVKAGSAIAGNIASRRAERRMRRRNEKELKDMREKEQRNYEQQYYADPLATAANQRTLTMMQNYLQEQRKASAGARGLGMGTEESAATEKAAGTAALADAASQMAAKASERQEQLHDNHQIAQEGYHNTKIGWNKEHFQNRLGQIQQGVQAGYEAGNSLIAAGKAFNSAQGQPTGDEGGGGMPQNIIKS